jgi:hypothetical protein
MFNCSTCINSKLIDSKTPENNNVLLCGFFTQTVFKTETCNQWKQKQTTKKDNEDFFKNKALAEKLKIKFNNQLDLFQ